MLGTQKILAMLLTTIKLATRLGHRLVMTRSPIRILAIPTGLFREKPTDTSRRVLTHLPHITGTRNRFMAGTATPAESAPSRRTTNILEYGGAG